MDRRSFLKMMAAVTGGLAIKPALGRTLGGLSGGFGYCLGVRWAKFCGDIEGIAWFAGNDLPDGKVAGELRAVFGIGFNAL